MRGGHPLFQAFQVGQHQFGFNRIGIGHRIDPLVDVLDVIVLETAQHMDDRVDFADVAQELVAQAFALARTAHETRDIDEAQLGRDDLGAAGNRRQLIKPRIRYADLADIGLDRTERIIRRLRRLRFGQRIEQGALADIGQADDTATKTHVLLRLTLSARP